MKHTYKLAVVFFTLLTLFTTILADSVSGEVERTQVDNGTAQLATLIPGLLEAGIYRARQVDERVYIERNVTKAGINDFDSDNDGWALVGRTNGAGENGDLSAFYVMDDIPYAVIRAFTVQMGWHYRLITPPYLTVVQKGQTRITPVIDRFKLDQTNTFEQGLREYLKLPGDLKVAVDLDLLPTPTPTPIPTPVLQLGKIITGTENVFLFDNITSPLNDVINLYIPPELGNQELAALGFLDVTAQPFNADPTGVLDSTQAIQDAVFFATRNQMVCYFPAGTYKVSDTIQCVQGLYSRYNSAGNKVSSTYFAPSVLMGSQADNAQRAKIILKPNSPGFSDMNTPKTVFHMWAPNSSGSYGETPNISFNQMIIGLDIEIGEGNSGAIGIRCQGAQGTSVQDVTINATNGFKGLEGGTGSGGSHHNVTVIGGRIGVDFSTSQPGPTMSGFTLINQTERAVIYGGRQTLSIVGLKVISNTAGPVIEGRGLTGAVNGHMSIADSQIEFEGYQNAVAVASDRSFYMNNIYIKNAFKVTELADGTSVSANPAGWVRVNEYAHEILPPLHSGKSNNTTVQIQYKNNIYVDGSPVSTDVKSIDINQLPPDNLLSQHKWGDNIATWDKAGAVNVKKAPYYAAGDGFTDDTAALQQAIDQNENGIVFIPKGVYRVTDTLKLKPNTKLVGISQAFSIIAVKETGAVFTASAASSKPVIETANDKNAETVLSFMCIYVPFEVPGAYALKWQAGSKSVYRSNDLALMPGVGYGRNIPDREGRRGWVEISGNGGGNWYNFYARNSLDDVREARLININGTSERLNFYHFNPEGAESEANAEIANSSNVNIYGSKAESNSYFLYIRDSSYIKVLGYSGNASAVDGSTLFKVDNTTNLTMAGLVDTPALPGTSQLGNAVGHDPELWYMVIHTNEGKVAKVQPKDRPILYKVGTALNGVVPTPTPTPAWHSIDDKASDIIFEGADWASQSADGSYDNTVMATYMDGSKASYTFSGTGARVYVKKTPKTAQINVYIDGIKVTPAPLIMTSATVVPSDVVLKAFSVKAYKKRTWNSFNNPFLD